MQQIYVPRVATVFTLCFRKKIFLISLANSKDSPREDIIELIDCKILMVLGEVSELETVLYLSLETVFLSLLPLP